MAFTRSRSRKIQVEDTLKDRIIIKTEIIDDSYEQYYASQGQFCHQIKSEMIDPGVFIKQEIDLEVLGYRAEIKAEEPSFEYDDILQNEPDRKRRRKNSSSDSGTYSESQKSDNTKTSLNEISTNLNNEWNISDANYHSNYTTIHKTILETSINGLSSKTIENNQSREDKPSESNIGAQKQDKTRENRLSRKRRRKDSSSDSGNYSESQKSDKTKTSVSEISTNLNKSDANYHSNYTTIHKIVLQTSNNGINSKTIENNQLKPRVNNQSKSNNEAEQQTDILRENISSRTRRRKNLSNDSSTNSELKKSDETKTSVNEISTKPDNDVHTKIHITKLVTNTDEINHKTIKNDEIQPHENNNLVSNDGDLKTHSYKDSKENTIKCSICIEKFKTITDCMIHENTVHHFEHQYQCSNCSFIAKNKISFHKHIRNHQVDLNPSKQTGPNDGTNDLNISTTTENIQRDKTVQMCSNSDEAKLTSTSNQAENLEIEGVKKMTKSGSSCGKNLSKSKLLQKHRLLTDKQYRALVDNIIPKDIQFPVGDYKCYSCSTNFTKLEEWKQHIISYLKLSGCFTIPQQELLRNNLKDGWKKIDDNKFACKFCPFISKHRTFLFKHISAKHNAKPIKCAICPKKTKVLCHLLNHLNREHNKIREKYQCSKCEHQTHDLYCLKVHEKYYHCEVRKLQCEHCNSYFSNKITLIKHIKIKHLGEKSSKIYKCTDCEYTFTYKPYLNRHYKQMHVEKMVNQCFYCLFKTTSKKNISRHIQNFHMKNEIIRNHKCSICGFKCSSVSGLKTHTFRKHSDPNRFYNCNICEESFELASACISHKNIVHDSKPELQCNQCSYITEDKYKFHLHIESHKKKFYCGYCNKSIRSKAYLSIHIMKKHSSERTMKKVSKNSSNNRSNISKWKQTDDSKISSNETFINPDGNDNLNTSKMQDTNEEIQMQENNFSDSFDNFQQHKDKIGGDPSMTTKLLHNYPPLSDKEYFLIVDKLLTKPISQFPSDLYKCYSCSEVFTKLDDIKQHILSYLKFSSCFTKPLLAKYDSVNWTKLNEKFECKRCTFNSESYQDIIHHLFDKHKLLAIKCAFCSENFEKIPLFLKHLKYKHKLCKDKYHCSICNYKTSAVVALRTHERQCHNIGTRSTIKTNGEYKCEECGISCKNDEDLKIHTYCKHSKKDKPIKCNVCVEKFKTITDCMIHENTVHHFRHQYQCNNCSFIAENKINFQKHIKNHQVDLNQTEKSSGLNEEKTLSDNVSTNDSKSNGITKNVKSEEVVVKSEPSVNQGETKIISTGHKQKKLYETSYGVTLSKNKLLQKHPVLTDKQYRALVDNIIPKDLQFPVGDYKCYSCSTNFTKLEEWKQHIMSYLKLSGCFTIPQQEMLGNNLKGDWKKIDNNMFACEFCPFTTKYRQDVIQHILAKHRAIPLKCAICPNESNTLAYLLKHLNYKHNKIRDKYQCSKCEYQTYDSVSLRTHETINHSKANKFQCKYCDYIFSTEDKWMKHTKVKHLGEKLPKLFKCTDCKYSTTNMFYLKGHFKRKHVNEGTINECFYCPYKSMSKAYLSAHIQKLHMKNKIIRNHTCSQCGFKCRTVTGLKNHTFYKHSDRNRYVNCNICKESFDSAAACASHKNIVHDSKPELQCNQCSYKGEDKYSFHQHIENHQRIFYCAHCNKSARTKLLVLAHIINKHDPKARKYKCTKCPYRAKNRTLFLQHCNVKHNPNPIMYTCYHCGHKNKIKHKLAQHMQTKHADILRGKKKNTKNN